MNEIEEKLNALCSIRFELGRRYEAGMPMYSWDTFKQDNAQEFATVERLYQEILELCKTATTPPQS